MRDSPRLISMKVRGCADSSRPRIRMTSSAVVHLGYSVLLAGTSRVGSVSSVGSVGSLAIV